VVSASSSGCTGTCFARAWPGCGSAAAAAAADVGLTQSSFVRSFSHQRGDMYVREAVMVWEKGRGSLSSCAVRARLSHIGEARAQPRPPLQTVICSRHAIRAHYSCTSCHQCTLFMYVLPPMLTIHVHLPPMRAHITLSKPNRCDERSPKDMRKKKPWLRRPRTHYRKDDPN
jgi:hypothetical protein